jgi:hypothetical protein
MLDPFPVSPGVRSPLGRLLMQISWEYAVNAPYREGGRGMENVLSAEIVQALDALPREYFLGELLRRCDGGAVETRAQLTSECEQAELLLLPGSSYLRPSLQSHSASVGVNPDVLIQSPGVYAFVEVKRARPPASFQAEQLSREYATVCRDTGARRPLLLLLIPHKPPVPVQGQGRKGIREAIVDNLPVVLEKFEGTERDLEWFCQRIEDTVAWITWAEMRALFAEQCKGLSCEPASVHQAVVRLATAAVAAIDWHS